jgi:hypothetical protein
MVIVRSDREADDSLVNLGVITDSFFDNESLKDPEKPLVIGRLLVPSVRRRNLGDQMFAESAPNRKTVFRRARRPSRRRDFPLVR